ncbi:hypothetical protein FJY68_11135 [candidate division WOR-3 bacterium]|uniref:Uncharacterized protein n=1 Tax=candidate division WOR-3 bacterium TaxID=2052148 RepID=A0A938BQQ1_UNCW3|nr:hypothetical protein [candidate division WOR-3 bacterium]
MSEPLYANVPSRPKLRHALLLQRRYSVSRAIAMVGVLPAQFVSWALSNPVTEVWQAWMSALKKTP